MEFSKRLTLSYYKKIADLNAEHHVYLVQHQDSGKFFVEKEMTVYDLGIFQQLQQANIIGVPKIIELVEENGVLTVIEDYISGATLQETIDQGKLDLTDMTNYFCQLCDVLSNLHQLTPPIIHRDLKPANIMITPTNNLVLLDFNAAKFYSTAKEEDTVLLGTKGYAAPEQYGFGVSTTLTDVFALGKVLEEMVGALSVKTPVYDAIIKKATQLNPADRYSSVSELKKVFAAGPKVNINAGAAGKIVAQFESDAQTAKITSSSANEPVPLKTKLYPTPTNSSTKFSANMSWLPPGFRTRTVWKMIIAALGYVFIFSLSLTLEVEKTFGAKLLVERLFCLTMLLSVVAIASNYRGVQKIVPFAHSKNHVMYYIGVALFAFLVVIALFFVMALVEAFF